MSTVEQHCADVSASARRMENQTQRFRAVDTIKACILESAHQENQSPIKIKASKKHYPTCKQLTTTNKFPENDHERHQEELMTYPLQGQKYSKPLKSSWQLDQYLARLGASTMKETIAIPQAPAALDISASKKERMVQTLPAD